MTGKGEKGKAGRGRAASESGRGRLSMSLLAGGRTTITSEDADEVITMLTQRSTSSTTTMSDSAAAPSSAVSTPTATATIGDEYDDSQQELFSQQTVPLPAPGGAICEQDKQSDVEDVSMDEDDEVVDVTWEPSKQQEGEGSSEGESESQTGTNKRQREKSRSPSPAPPGRTAAPPVTPTTTKSKKTPAAGSSAVWTYFTVSSKESNMVICNLCHKKLSRGKPGGRPGTTCMRRHLKSEHAALWRECENPTSTDTPSSGDSRPSTPSVPSCTPPPSTPVFPSTSARKCLQQTSMLTFLESQKKMSPTSQLARRLTGALTELIVRQLLSYHLVDTAAFKKFAAVAAPTWKVPSRKFMSETAVPDLHRHVQRKLTSSLAHSVGGKVHLTTDTWSSKHGQGRYMTVTAHWVNLQSKPLSHGQLSTSKVDLVEPPRMACLPAATSSSSSSSPSSLWPSPAESPSSSALVPKSYGHCQVRRCHAVLSMECLGPQSHTAPVLWSALQAQEAQWLTPHNLRLGHVVSDNGSNLVAALKMGKVLHVPCLAHVLNIVVQKFIHKYPGLQEMIKLARKVSGHFRRSYTAMARLEAIQKKRHLPMRRPVCDSATRWNSTLFMLERLWQQRHAVTEYLCDIGYATATRDLGMFNPQHWVLMRDVCRLLRPFSEITNLVSRSEANISDMVPYIVLLQRALHRITDQAVDERENLENLAVSGEAEGDMPTTSHEPGPTQEEEEEEEEADFDADDEEEELPHLGPSQVGCHLSGTPAIVRGWAEDTEQDNVEDDEPQLTSACNLVGMGSFLLCLLKKDPRVKNVMEKEELYWVATILHPNYKDKVLEMMPPAQQRDVGRIQALTNRLKNLLYAAFPYSSTTAAGSGARRGNPPATTKAARRSVDVAVTMDMLSFFSPGGGNQARSSAPTTTMSTHRDRLDRQVNDYMSITADMHTFDSLQDPLNYWLSRLDIWPQLSELAMEILSCPASSVLSERTFSAAGGIVTDKRTRLAHSSVDYLTFIKMNEEWISEAYISSRLKCVTSSIRTAWLPASIQTTTTMPEKCSE